MIKDTPCYCLKMRRASGNITKFYDRMLETSGVTVAQFSLLNNISKAKRGSLSELAEMAELDRSTLARNVKPLLHKGLVYDAKEKGSRDSQLKLTSVGQETIDQAQMLWDEAQKQIINQLGEKGIADLERVLGILTNL